MVPPSKRENANQSTWAFNEQYRPYTQKLDKNLLTYEKKRCGASKNTSTSPFFVSNDSFAKSRHLLKHSFLSKYWSSAASKAVFLSRAFLPLIRRRPNTGISISNTVTVQIQASLPRPQQPSQIQTLPQMQATLHANKKGRHLRTDPRKERAYFACGKPFT